jgi:sterol desaturase/sphingolipid hydroxylase (fatty acid hydroxylase superfamily)
MAPSLIIPAVVLIALCFAVFGALAKLFPCDARRPVFASRAIGLDMGYCLLGVAYAAAGPLAGAALAASPLAGLADRIARPAIGELPLGGQLTVLLVVTDFAQYWLHRAFHAKRFWPIHAIHHSARDVNWTTTFRTHPINYLVQNAALGALARMAGFSETCLLVAAPVFFFSGAITHANLCWTFGPFRYVLASPVFHRWHHAADPAGQNRNFAPMFPVWDLMFGTFHMPHGERPGPYGAAGVPDGMVGQLVHPFRPGAAA